MKLVHLSVCLIACALASGTAAAQTLWQNVSVGMSIADVQAAQPSATTPTTASTLKSGAKCSLQIPTFEISGNAYEICFYFLGEKLTQVMMSDESSPTHGQYTSLITLLRAKYGTELSSGKNAIGYEAEWTTGEGVNISVLYIDQLMKLINIVYQTRVADESKKL